jgi:TetR/AcrR family transcriptional repressor of mexJK operon
MSKTPSADDAGPARKAGTRTQAASPGRPKDLEKRALILQGARRLFFAHGVEGVTMEAIAAEAGVSKVTVYGHFGDKETVFEAMVRSEAARIEQEMLDLRVRGATLRETLVAFGTNLLDFLMDPNLVAFDNLIGLEAQRHPDLARRFFEAGPGYVRAQLARIIAAGHERGELEVDDPLTAAEDLASLWQGFLPLTMKLGVGLPPTGAALRHRVVRGVELFLRAHAPRTRTGG